MIPTVIPVANVMYRSFYDEQEYRQRMQQLADVEALRNGASNVAAPGSRIAMLVGRLRAAAPAAVVAVAISLQRPLNYEVTQ